MEHRLPVAPTCLERCVDAAAPNRSWVGDIAYVWTAQSWLYLAVLLDLFSRRVVGWSMATTLERDLPASTAN